MCLCDIYLRIRLYDYYKRHCCFLQLFPLFPVEFVTYFDSNSNCFFNFENGKCTFEQQTTTNRPGVALQYHAGDCSLHRCNKDRCRALLLSLLPMRSALALLAAPFREHSACIWSPDYLAGHIYRQDLVGGNVPAYI